MKILKNSNGQIVTYNNDPIIAEHTGITPLAYTVTFMVEGAVKYIISVDAGCSINEPPGFNDVTSAWFGWWTNEAMIGGTKIIFPYTPTADITVYGISSTLAGQTWLTPTISSEAYGIFNLNFSIPVSPWVLEPNSFEYLAVGYGLFIGTTSAYGYLSGRENRLCYISTTPFTKDGQLVRILEREPRKGDYASPLWLDTYRIQISFVDGNDIANQSLVNWLSTNGTRIS